MVFAVQHRCVALRSSATKNGAFIKQGRTQQTQIEEPFFYQLNILSLLIGGFTYA